MSDHDSTTTPRVRRGCAIGCLAALLLAGGVIWAAALSFPLSSGKYEPAAWDGGPPRDQAGPLTAERQTEPHTCGLHSLRAIYRAYGLDPVALELRFRLGVDRPGVPFDAETLGTIHPDLFRVAAQDGFVIDVADDPAMALPVLRAHLAAGHAAALLIRSRNRGALHWVVADAIDADGIRIHDSLRDQPYHEPVPGWLASHVLSVLLLRPAREPANPTASEAHAAGLAEMRRVAARLDD